MQIVSKADNLHEMSVYFLPKKKKKKKEKRKDTVYFKMSSAEFFTQHFKISFLLTLKVPVATAADDILKYFFLIFQRKQVLIFHMNHAGLGGSVGCAVRLETRRSRVQPPPRSATFFVEIDREIFSTVILSLPLIQEGQLSVSGERMCTILVNRLED